MRCGKTDALTPALPRGQSSAALIRSGTGSEGVGCRSATFAHKSVAPNVRRNVND